MTQRTRPAGRLASAAAVLALAAACAPAAPETASAPAPAPIEPALALATFDSAWSRIDNTYYDTTFKGMDWRAVRDELRPRVERATTEAEVRAAIREMLERIGDSHFALIPREAADALNPDDLRAGDGVPATAGMELRMVDGEVTVFRVLPGSGAEAAGVRAGDAVLAAGEWEAAAALRILESVEGEAARRAAESEVVGAALAAFAGSPGDTVRARFDTGAGSAERAVPLRPLAGEPVRFGNLPTFFVRIGHERIGPPGDCVGYIHFNVWMPQITPAFGRAMDALAECRGIVLDLRGNPGGAGGLAMGVAGAFVDETVPFGIMRTRQAEMRFVAIPRRVTADARPTRPFAGPLAVLVDGQSASTSEIFALGMQYLERGRVFGETTPGMALPAVMVRLPNRDVLYHAFADFTDPGGVRVEGRGVVPDEPVPLTRADLLAGRDPVQQAAVEWIRRTTQN